MVWKEVRKGRVISSVLSIQFTCWGTSPSDRATITLFSSYVVWYQGYKSWTSREAFRICKFLAVYHCANYFTSVNLSFLIFEEMRCEFHACHSDKVKCCKHSTQSKCPANSRCFIIIAVTIFVVAVIVVMQLILQLSVLFHCSVIRSIENC